MCLMIALIAAVASTLVWYGSVSARELKISILCWLFWGASLMWLVDAAFEYAEQGAEFFTPAASDMLNDAFLGISVVVLALVIWIAVLLVKDPKGVIRETLLKKNC